MLSNAIENAQRRVEGKNFDIRRHVLQYDDVMNQQRELIYAQRRKVLDGENLKEYYVNMIETIVGNLVDAYCSESPHPDHWDMEGLILSLEGILLHKGALKIEKEEWNYLTKEDLKERVISIALEEYEKREQEIGSELMREVERVVLLRVVESNLPPKPTSNTTISHFIS
jgi:preprotein translocase subunit SecA